MARVYQVPSHAFFWLVSGVLIATVPHLFRGPVWLFALAGLAVLWRILIQLGRVRYPGPVTRGLLLLSAVLGTLYTHGTILGPDAGTCILVAAFALKLLESVRVRDAYITIVFGYFVIATAFLFYQGPLAGLYVIAGMVLLSAALIGINQPETGPKAAQHLRLSGLIVLQAVPLTLVLFIFVPRVPPLWSLGVEQREARTGMTDSMAPGEVSRLSRSDAVAFRVEFDGAVPAYQDRYWRGLTYSHYDGRRWTQKIPINVSMNEYVYFPGSAAPGWIEDVQQIFRDREGTASNRYSYRIIMEPTGHNWLYALAIPFSENRQIGLARDVRLVSRHNITQRLAYSVKSDTLLRQLVPLASWEKTLSLELPDGFNPRALAQARQWRSQMATDLEYARHVLQWFNREKFYYTIEPAPTGRHMVDDFIFDTRRGFCEHYAAAFVFLMRAAGIPARVVAGYLGGEFNPLGTHMIVRQRDAHAWTEIWLEERGWVEVDPTAAVAPERIELSLDDVLADELGMLGTGYLSQWLADSAIARQARYLADYVQFVWQRWVLGYDTQTQIAFLKKWFGDMSTGRVLSVLAGSFGILLLFLAFWVLAGYRRNTHSVLYREYRHLCGWLEYHGVRARPGETPIALASRAAEELPHFGDDLRHWACCFEQLAYDRGTSDAESWVALRRARRRLLWMGTLRGRMISRKRSGRGASR